MSAGLSSLGPVLSMNSPSDEIDAPDNRNSLSPICIGNTFRAGSTMGIEGSSNVLLGPLERGSVPAVSDSVPVGLAPPSESSVPLKRRALGPA